MNSICLNGKILPADQPLFNADNRGYRYGDGLFETIKVVNAEIVLDANHFKRLFTGMQVLNYTVPKHLTIEKLRNDILQLCAKNKCEKSARVRLSVFNGHGGLYDGDDQIHYLAECWPINKTTSQLNENGLIIGVFTGCSKATDPLSNLKSANFLPYTLAARYAKANQLNDCLVLNTSGRIADSTIANLFMIKDGVIHTPPLTEGCVAGVMRGYLLESLSAAGYKVEEKPLTIEWLLQADEVFLTNAINGIRWVKRFGDTTYHQNLVPGIYNRLIQTIFN
jgi:branched-chain amino acid aminotransferase